MGTLTTVDRYALVHRNNSGGAEMTTSVTEYLRTLTTSGHQSLIQAGPRGGRPKVTCLLRRLNRRKQHPPAP
jgi:DNA (cytosine-5)-methyltransferase 1